MPGTQQFGETKPISNGGVIVNAGGTTHVSTCPSSNVARRFDMLLLCTDEAGSITVDVWGNYGGSDVRLGSVSVPAGTGTGGTAPKEVLSALLPADQVGIALQSSHTILISPSVAITSGKNLWWQVIGGEL